MNNIDQEVAQRFLGLTDGVPEPYSTSIASAWKVLEQIHGRGWFWRMDSVHNGVIITVQNKARVTYQIKSEDAPKAICEAALKVANSSTANEVR